MNDATVQTRANPSLARNLLVFSPLNVRLFYHLLINHKTKLDWVRRGRRAVEGEDLDFVKGRWNAQVGGHRGHRDAASWLLMI